MGDLPDLFDRLDGADLIVGKHHRDQNGLRTDSRFQLIQLHYSVLVHIHISHFKPVLLQKLGRVKNGMVLDLRGDDVIALVPVCFRSGLQRPVVALRAACGEIDLIAFGAQHFRDVVPLQVERFFIGGSKPVDAGRVSVFLCKIRKHGLHYLRRRLGGRRVIQINQFFHI